MSDLWNTLSPYLADALIAIITAGVPLVVAWMRNRTQHIVAAAAAAEAERQGEAEGLDGPTRKALAMHLAKSRMGRLVRPNEDRLSRMVEEAVPAAKASVRPPAPEE